MERMIGNQEEPLDLKSIIDSQSQKINKHEVSSTRMENQNSTQMTQNETQSRGSVERRKCCTHEEAQEHHQQMELERNLKHQRLINERVNTEAQSLHQVER
ncbi:hypothetical protein O181_020268 [Austropuccinia psidii MF-1]|uniref:Uncharacterized protein n=1 Tax=Austropuccinia psidii MF-1 TaxID=1389203 RepID=A0A9Q3CCL1_9BASI|nr:hypothetical protein [Austropuccinia psidii MF-1]